MISSDFYTTDQTTTSGFQLTGLINTIKSNYNEDFGNPYMMGYIPYENIPSQWKPFKIEYNAERNAIIAKSVMIPQNVGWGYVANIDNNLQTGFSDVYEYSNIWSRIATTTDPKIRFINAGEIPKLNTIGLISFYNIVIKHDLSTDEYVLNTTARQHTNIYVKDFIDFLNGNTTMEFLINGNNVAIECVTDDDGLIVYNDGTNDYYIIITYFACSQDTGNVQSSFRNYFNPFIKFTVQNEDDENTILEIPYTYGVSGSGYSYLVNATTSVVSEQSCSKFSDYFFGNISEGEYDLTDAQTLQTDYYKRFGNTFITRGSNNRYFVVCNYSSDDLLSMLTIVNKYKNNSQADTFLNGYDTTVSVAIFDTNNVPKRIRLSDTYTNLVAKLQPWQIPNVDITANEFDPKDIPPYKPTPDDDDSSGDDIRPYNFVNTPLGAANNFITLYSLNTAQVADFGRRMWASLSDTAFWETVGTVFLNDFSINPADMMKYFVSLRYFPFDLSIVHSSQTWGIYIGRSSYPIQPSIGTELPHRITRNLVQLDGGSVFVPNHYNDFRDYEPYTKVSVTVPFCGVLELTPSEVVGKTLYLDYVIDLQTGTIKSTVSVQSNTFFIVGSLSGVCGSQIPLTANNNIEFLQRIANVGSSIISSGSSAGSAADKVAGLTGSGAIGAVAGGVVMGANAVGSMLSLPPITVHKQGNATGFANYGGSSQAYLTVQRQKYIVPDNYGHSVGYATAFNSVLSSLSGFTVCSNVDLSGFTCHEDERAEIKSLLESGVYL